MEPAELQAAQQSEPDGVGVRVLVSCACSHLLRSRSVLVCSDAAPQQFVFKAAMAALSQDSDNFGVLIV